MADSDSLQLHLSSKNATSYNNNLTSDCNFILPMIEVPSQHYLYMSVIHAVIPYSFYQIDKSNNILSYTINSITLQVLIEPGNYNARQLSLYLTNNMTGFTITYNSIYNKFTFTHISTDFIFNVGSTCFGLLGISAVNLNSVSNQLISYQSIDLMPHKCLCVSSNLVTSSFNLSSQSELGVLISLPITSAPYSMITYRGDMSHQQCLYKNSFSSIHLRLTDQHGKSLDLNNIHWAITLQLNVIKFVE